MVVDPPSEETITRWGVQAMYIPVYTSNNWFPLLNRGRLFESLLRP